LADDKELMSNIDDSKFVQLIDYPFGKTIEVPFYSLSIFCDCDISYVSIKLLSF